MYVHCTHIPRTNRFLGRRLDKVIFHQDGDAGGVSQEPKTATNWTKYYVGYNGSFHDNDKDGLIHPVQVYFWKGFTQDLSQGGWGGILATTNNMVYSDEGRYWSYVTFSSYFVDIFRSNKRTKKFISSAKIS